MTGSRRRRRAVNDHNVVQVLIAVRNTIDILADRAAAPLPLLPCEAEREFRAVVRVMDRLLVQIGPPEWAGESKSE